MRGKHNPIKTNIQYFESVFDKKNDDDVDHFPSKRNEYVLLI